MRSLLSDTAVLHAEKREAVLRYTTTRDTIVERRDKT
jgi:hypothetical protein